MRHGAKLKRKQCKHEGCTNIVVNGGVCIRHGAKKEIYLTNRVVKGGVCIKHGSKRKTCSHEKS